MKCTCSATRREFLGITTRTATAALASRYAKWLYAEPENGDVTELSAVEAGLAIIRGDLKAEEYTEALIRRCDAGRSLNVFISRMDREKVMEAARAADEKRASAAVRGVLHGIPVMITDSIITAALPTTAGTKGLRSLRPIADATVVARLLREGSASASRIQ